MGIWLLLQPLQHDNLLFLGTQAVAKTPDIFPDVAQLVLNEPGVHGLLTRFQVANPIV